MLSRPLRVAGVDEALALALDEVIAGALARDAGLEVTTIADVAALLEAERLRDLLGCDELTCMVDLGGALGADRILSGSIGRVGVAYVLALQWIDAIYAEPLARVDLSVEQPEALIGVARQAVASLLASARGEDSEARRRKRQPTFWTAELGLGACLLPALEPYPPGAQLSARLAWGGRAGGATYYYVVAGLAGAHLAGAQERPGLGRVRYQRSQAVAHFGLRLAYPLGYRDRLRAFGGVAAALHQEHYHARQDDGLQTSGRQLFPELRVPVGIWYRWHYRHSLLVGYRLRLVFRGDGADPVSELVRLGGSKRLHTLSELEFGWAVHF